MEHLRACFAICSWRAPTSGGVAASNWADASEEAVDGDGDSREDESERARESSETLSIKGRRDRGGIDGREEKKDAQVTCARNTRKRSNANSHCERRTMEVILEQEDGWMDWMMGNMEIGRWSERMDGMVALAWLKLG